MCEVQVVTWQQAPDINYLCLFVQLRRVALGLIGLLAT